MRYTFSDIHDDRLRSDSARSQDGGRSWATSMIFEFARRDESAEPLHADQGESTDYGTSKPSRALDFLLGSRRGERAPTTDGAAADVIRETTLHLEGSLLITRETRTTGDESIAAMEFATFDAGPKRWIRYTIDEHAPRFRRWAGELDGHAVTWTTPSPGGSIAPPT